MFDAHRSLIGELDVDSANLRLFLRLARACDGSVSFDHGFGGTRGEGHFRSLRCALLVGILSSKFVEGYVAFFVGEFVSLRMSVLRCMSLVVQWQKCRCVLDPGTSVSWSEERATGENYMALSAGGNKSESWVCLQLRHVGAGTVGFVVVVAVVVKMDGCSVITSVRKSSSLL